MGDLHEYSILLDLEIGKKEAGKKEEKGKVGGRKEEGKNQERRGGRKGGREEKKRGRVEGKEGGRQEEASKQKGRNTQMNRKRINGYSNE